MARTIALVLIALTFACGAERAPAPAAKRCGVMQPGTSC